MTARVKLLELPERAQQLIGDGIIALSAVDQLRGRAARARAWLGARRRLTHAGDNKLFAAYLHSASSHEITDLRRGKKTEQLYAEAEKLHRQLDRYAYGPPPVRFTEQDVDQARAAGVLIEFERGRPIIVDRPLDRELRSAPTKTSRPSRRLASASRASPPAVSGS